MTVKPLPNEEVQPSAKEHDEHAMELKEKHSSNLPQDWVRLCLGGTHSSLDETSCIKYMFLQAGKGTMMEVLVWLIDALTHAAVDIQLPFHQTELH